MIAGFAAFAGAGASPTPPSATTPATRAGEWAPSWAHPLRRRRRDITLSPLGKVFRPTAEAMGGGSSGGVRPLRPVRACGCSAASPA